MTDVVQAAQLPQLVPLREFIISPGFIGAAIALATVIVMCSVAYWSRTARKQRDRHHQELREDARRGAAIERSWERLRWLIETAGIEPAGEAATLGLGPEVALELLRGLLSDAEDLADDSLIRAVMAYQAQFGLVLAQQGGPLSQHIPNGSTVDGKPDKRPASPPSDKTSDEKTPPASAAGHENTERAAGLAVGERRRGR